MYERLLVPIDLGVHHRDVIRFAKLIATPNATIRLVHVLTPDVAELLATAFPVDSVREHAERGLANYADAEAGGRQTWEFEVCEGEIAEHVLRKSIEWSADVVVLGSQGRRAAESRLLGSVAENVVSSSRVPVCIVKGDTPEALARVACATDLMTSSDAAELALGDLANATGARAFLVHAFNADQWSAAGGLTPELLAFYGLGPLDAGALAERIERERQRAASMLRGHVRIGGSIEPLVIEGEPCEAIADFATGHDVDLLILGTHHRSKIAHYFLGSIAEKTLRLASCPVLVVPDTVGPDSAA